MGAGIWEACCEALKKAELFVSIIRSYNFDGRVSQHFDAAISNGVLFFLHFSASFFLRYLASANVCNLAACSARSTVFISVLFFPAPLPMPPPITSTFRLICSCSKDFSPTKWLAPCPCIGRPSLGRLWRLQHKPPALRDVSLSDHAHLL